MRARRYLWRASALGKSAHTAPCAMPRVLLSAIPFSKPIDKTQHQTRLAPEEAPITTISHTNHALNTPSSSSSSSSSSPSPPSLPSSPSSPRPPAPFAFCQYRWQLQRVVEANNALYQRCLERLAIARLDCRAPACDAPVPLTRTRSAPALCPHRSASPGTSWSRPAGAC